METSRFGRYFVYELPIELDCRLVDQRNHNHLAVRVQGYAIEQFKNWEHSRRCREHGCSYGDASDPCLVRSGLIGRNFLGDNDLAMEISPASSRTEVRRL